jgi:hypothetical protein
MSPHLANVDVVMAVEIVRDPGRQEGTDAHGHGTEQLVPDVEVVVRLPATLPTDDAVIGVIGGELGCTGAKAGSDFQALSG